MKRCSWVNEGNPLYISYHDEEWGHPLYDDQKLYELLCMESYQAGLSWEIVLNKREDFRESFYHYDLYKVALMSDNELDSLLENPKIIRHKLKLYATRANAKAVLMIREQFGSFSNYLWSYIGGQTIVNSVKDYRERPSQTALSQRLSNELKKRGFKFLGPVAVYSFLQASGMINDHEDDCFLKNNI